MRSRPLLVAASWLVLATVPTVPAQVGPEESAKKLKPAEGTQAILFAAEPMVINPTNIDVDSRGRVWVTEGLNYRMYRDHGNNLARRDVNDMIKVLEDTDGDGKADKVTVFADKIYPVPMGIAVEEIWDAQGQYKGARVYVGNSPDLLVFEDTDGDDKADSRKPLLTGFGGIDSDHGVHGMVLGLDGKLYFTHGDGCCSVQPDKSQTTQNFDVTDSSGRHVRSDQLAHVLRCDRDGKNFEILADRQRNNYETTLNAFGNVFASDNDDDGNRGCRVIWIMEGGHYGYRTPGSPRHWGEEVPGNVPKLVGTGNGSPCGLNVYEGTTLPERFHGAIFEAEAGTRQINAFPLVRRGSAFRTAPDILLSSDDPWFRPVDVGTAPDGAVFVADWYDAGVGGHAFKDQTTGRIYRVSATGSASPKPFQPNFRTSEGLLEALKSPNVASQDAARRQFLAQGQSSCVALAGLAHGANPIDRARAFWVWHAIDGDSVAAQMLGDADARIREQGVRILGRDVSRFGQIELPEGTKPAPLKAVASLEILKPLAEDPDAGVRRELILALREVATDQAGDLLRTLAARWDGNDRWYLEALGLALEKRESDYIASLFDGTLYGDMAEPAPENVARPPFFPADRNEAFLGTEDPDPPANAASKTLGLAWRLRRFEAAPAVLRMLPELEGTPLQQSADDVLKQMNDPETAVRLADLAGKTSDPTRRRQLLVAIAAKLAELWRPAAGRPEVVAQIEAALGDAAFRSEGLALAAASGDGRYAPRIKEMIADEKLGGDLRAEAVGALARLKPEGAKEVLDNLVSSAKGKPGAGPVAEAAVRALARFGDDHGRMLALMRDGEYPIGLRREALRTAASFKPGAEAILDLAEKKELPDELRSDAATTLYGHPERPIRDRAQKVLPPLVSRTGRPLPPIYELVRRDGDAARGAKLFHQQGNNACSNCHRAQGKGQWIGPDLSTIGTKYGKDELLRSILNPNAAIGYNYRSTVAVTKEGQVVTGLMVEETPTELVLKTAEGRRQRLPVAEIDERQLSDVSLMPEGLAANYDDQELVDLITYMATLRKPVSIVGEFEVIGPLAADQVHPGAADEATWSRAQATAEGIAPIVAAGSKGQAALVRVPIVAPAAMSAQLVIDAPGTVAAWLDGKKLDGKESALSLPKGASTLLIKVEGADEAKPSLGVTLVADRPIEFRAADGR